MGYCTGVQWEHFSPVYSHWFFFRNNLQQMTWTWNTIQSHDCSLRLIFPAWRKCFDVKRLTIKLIGLRNLKLGWVDCIVVVMMIVLLLVVHTAINWGSQPLVWGLYFTSTQGVIRKLLIYLFNPSLNKTTIHDDRLSARFLMSVPHSIW